MSILSGDGNGIGAVCFQYLGFAGVVGVLISALVFWCVGVAGYRLTFHPLAKYPGPKLAAVTRLWHSYHAYHGQLHYVYLAQHKQHGPVIRVAPNELSFCDSQAWSDIFGVRQGKPEMSKETPYYRNPYVPYSIVNAALPDHTYWRRLLARGFSEGSLREQEPVIQDLLDLMIARLHEQAAKGEESDMVKWFNFLTFDTIGRLTFGETFECLENSVYHPWVSIVFQSLKCLCVLQIFSYYPYIPVRLLGIFMPPDLPRKLAAHDDLTAAKTQRRQALTDRADLMTHLFAPENQVPEPHLRGNTSSFIIAGSETTATLLDAAVFYLAQHPAVYRRLTQEVRAAFPTRRDVTVAAVSRLQYLLAVLNETLRIYPPAPGAFTRRVPEGGDYVSGKYVPGGTIVGICIYATHRSPANFACADEFLPERWLPRLRKTEDGHGTTGAEAARPADGDARFAADDRRALQPFSYGPRNCLGVALAQLEMRLFLARFVWEFDFALAREDGTTWLDGQKMYIVWEKAPLLVRLTPVERA